MIERTKEAYCWLMNIAQASGRMTLGGMSYFRSGLLIVVPLEQTQGGKRRNGLHGGRLFHQKNGVERNNKRRGHSMMGVLVHAG